MKTLVPNGASRSVLARRSHRCAKQIQSPPANNALGAETKLDNARHGRASCLGRGEFAVPLPFPSRRRRERERERERQSSYSLGIGHELNKADLVHQRTQWVSTRVLKQERAQRCRMRGVIGLKSRRGGEQQKAPTGRRPLPQFLYSHSGGEAIS